MRHKIDDSIIKNGLDTMTEIWGCYTSNADGSKQSHSRMLSKYTIYPIFFCVLVA